MGILWRCTRKRLVRRAALFFGVSLSLVYLGAFTACDAAAAEPPALEVLGKAVLLPDLLRWAFDVRLAGDGSALVAAGKEGVFSVNLDGTQAPRLVVPCGHGLRSLWLASRLGLSERFIVVAAPAFSLSVIPRHDPELPPPVAIDAIVDIDVHDDRLLVLGGHRDAKTGRWCPDGAIAWITSLGQRVGELRPVYFAASGPGAVKMDLCGPLDLGAVRFMDDGSFVVVPGVEPGVYLYRPNGVMTRAWQANEIGFESDCTVTRAEAEELSRTRELKYAWLAQRPVIDDVLPLRQGPALVIRRVANGASTWELLVLRQDAPPLHYRIPLTSKSDRSHLRGDVRDGKILLLLVEHGDQRPIEAPRLLCLGAPK